ncbi:Farnesol dehydrogenase [Pseudolycoriella hygida]|uniref:Farnesol dehydrogenase n=1 Tax=Pseudolycoriella hygida TaxID=35572 RepID=A0A9Q0RWZ5_9DIPT|nr:Farnesol dehydrogenase [Pseudolycoriella hygida]
MERWLGKVAVVTGSSSGIGACIASELAKEGMTVIALARRLERLEQVKDQIPADAKGVLHARQCDVTEEEEVKSTFQWINEQFGGIDVLVNNAGVVRSANLIDADNTTPIREIVETNIMGVVYCTREAFQSMKHRNVDGHIIMINSVAGHHVPFFAGTMSSFNIYPGTKHAVTAMTEVLRQEFLTHGTKTKITSISPGIVQTEIFLPENVDFIKTVPHLKVEDIAAAVTYVLGTPPHVQVHELTIKPVGEQF